MPAKGGNVRGKPAAKPKPETATQSPTQSTQLPQERVKIPLTVERVADVFKRSYGNVVATAEAFGVARCTVYAFMKSHPDLVQVLEDCRQAHLDNVESRFYADCLKDDPKYQISRIHFLKTQGRERGYGDRTEISGVGGGPIESMSTTTTTVNGVVTVQHTIAGVIDQLTAVLAAEMGLGDLIGKLASESALGAQLPLGEGGECNAATEELGDE